MIGSRNFYVLYQSRDPIIPSEEFPSLDARARIVRATESAMLRTVASALKRSLVASQRTVPAISQHAQVREKTRVKIRTHRTSYSISKATHSHTSRVSPARSVPLRPRLLKRRTSRYVVTQRSMHIFFIRSRVSRSRGEIIFRVVAHAFSIARSPPNIFHNRFRSRSLAFPVATPLRCTPRLESRAS